MLKLLLIGFDGLDSEMLRERFDEMFLGRLGGTLVTMKPTIPVTLDGWMEIYYGKRRSLIRDRDIPLWRHLNKEYRVGMFGLPYTHPARDIDGWWVSGYPAKKDMSIVYPKKLLPYLFEHIVDLMDISPKPEGYEEWIMSNNYLVASHLSLILALNIIEPVEVLLVQFSFFDHLLHLLGWKREEPHHDRLLDYLFKKIDEIVRFLFLTLKPENLVLCSDHGYPALQNHRNTGTAYFYGVDIKKAEGLEMRNIDLFPTLIYLLDLPSLNVEGRCLYELFKSQEISEEDEKRIKEKLRRLGYEDSPD